MAYPPVVVVDEQDNVIGNAPLAEVLEKGLYHRIVSVHVQDEGGAMLLQLRSPHVRLYPNSWDQAAGGHVDEGHTYESAALAELEEELGITDVPLRIVDTYRYRGKEGEASINQFVRVYLVTVSRDSQIHIEPKEITTVQWFTLDELRMLVHEQPEHFTPGYLQELRSYFLAN